MGRVWVGRAGVVGVVIRVRVRLQVQLQWGPSAKIVVPYGSYDVGWGLSACMGPCQVGGNVGGPKWF